MIVVVVGSVKSVGNEVNYSLQRACAMCSDVKPMLVAVGHQVWSA